MISTSSPKDSCASLVTGNETNPSAQAERASIGPQFNRRLVIGYSPFGGKSCILKKCHCSLEYRRHIVSVANRPKSSPEATNNHWHNDIRTEEYTGKYTHCHHRCAGVVPKQDARDRW